MGKENFYIDSRLEVFGKRERKCNTNETFGVEADVETIYVVRAGSVMRMEELPSIAPYASKIRKMLIDSGQVVNGRFVKDVLFRNKSLLGSVLHGRSSNKGI